jgi:hypothetical protein
MFVNESCVVLNNLNSCKHRIGRHRDIAIMYCPMLTKILRLNSLRVIHGLGWPLFHHPYSQEKHSFFII